MTNQYEARAFCGNCGYEGPVMATVGEYVYKQPCPLCACHSLLPTAKREWDRVENDAR